MVPRHPDGTPNPNRYMRSFADSAVIGRKPGPADISGPEISAHSALECDRAGVFPFQGTVSAAADSQPVSARLF